MSRRAACSLRSSLRAAEGQQCGHRRGAPSPRRLMMGEAFVDVDSDTATEFIGKQKEASSAQCARRWRAAAAADTARTHVTPLPPACARLQANEAAIASLLAELTGINARQQELKKILYGRFGKSINLEDS